MDGSDTLVTIATLQREEQAELLRGHLAAHGIASVLQNVETARLRLEVLGSQAFHVQLQVRAGDAPAAARLLAEWERSGAGAGGRAAGERCLACGAPLAAEDERCAACGWTWLEA